MEIVLYPAVTWYFLGIHDDLNHIISLNNEFFTVNLYKNQNIYFSLQGTNQAQIHTGFHSFTEICWICQNHRQTQKRRLKGEKFKTFPGGRWPQTLMCLWPLFWKSVTIYPSSAADKCIARKFQA